MKGVETTVWETSTFTFSISKTYQTSITCDIIEMDAYHVILGRPWQFDNWAIYDGYKNTYEIFWEGKKIICLLTTLSYSKKSVPKINIVVDEPRLFYSHLLTNQVGWLLLNKGIDKQQSSNDHPDLANLLQEFSDLIMLDCYFMV